MKRLLLALLVIASFPEYVLFIFTAQGSVATASFYTLNACQYAASLANKRVKVETAYCVKTY